MRDCVCCELHDCGYETTFREGNWQQCFNCLVPEQACKSIRCSGCKVATYCGKKCQADHWQAHHGKECSRLTEVYAADVNALEQTSLAKPRLLSNGDIFRIARSCLACGHCTKSTTTCTCTGLGIGSDITLVSLPPPSEHATQQHRIRRFCSIISSLPQMDGLKVLKWQEESACRLEALFASFAQGLRKLMQMHLTVVSADHNKIHEYAEFFRIAGHCQLLPNERDFAQMPLLIHSSCIALEIFLMGDWSCLTMVDCSLLIKFLDDASLYDLLAVEDDIPLLQDDFMTFHSVIKTIMLILSRMRSIYGTRIALENKRGIRLPGTFVLSKTDKVRGMACFHSKDPDDVPIFEPSTLDYEQMWVPSAAERDLVKEVAFQRYPKEKAAFKPRSIREDFPYTIVE